MPPKRKLVIQDNPPEPDPFFKNEGSDDELYAKRPKGLAGKSRKAKKEKLPMALIAIGNKDKAFHESWYPGRNPLNFPHPWRLCGTGPPNKGKSTAAKNIILRADPPFQKITIVHADGANTKEYDDLGKEGVTITSVIPAIEDWEGEVKECVIVDDIHFGSLNKEQKKALNRLIGYVSTHKNISVICLGQIFFEHPVILRRCANIHVIWQGDDKADMQRIAGRVGIPDLDDLMTRICPEFNDSLWIDKTRGTPFPFRTNGFNDFQFLNESDESEQE
jgi:hypothetical protein